MDDKFLYQLREQPDPEFVRDLQERITSTPPSVVEKFKGLSLVPQCRDFTRNLIFAIGGSALIFLVFVFVSPAARAQVEEIIKEIAGIRFVETESYPSESPFVGGIFGGEPPHQVSQQSMSLHKAKTIVPFKFMPSWIPEDMKLKNTIVNKLEFPDGTPGWDITVFWERVVCQGCDRSYIYLFARSPIISEQNSGDFNLNMIVGKNAVKGIDINGNEAALVRGYWFKNGSFYPLHERQEPLQSTATPEWYEGGSALGIRLIWIKNDVLYTLLADENYVSVDELIRISESIP